MILGILRTDTVRKELSEQFGEYPDMFQRLFHAIDPELHIVPYDVQKGEYPISIDDCNAYLITGSSSSVYEDREWIHRLGDFIRELHVRKKKTVGICFGHQLVAHVLGGKTEKTGWHIGTKPHVLNEYGEKLTQADRFNLIFSHQDQVTIPVPGSQILASTKQCPIAICNIDDLFFTIQGHPEYEPDYARQLIESRKQIYKNGLYEEAIESLEGPHDGLEAARMILEFIKK